jgi:putative spermidine/putrescine transport system permease protein
MLIPLLGLVSFTLEDKGHISFDAYSKLFTDHDFGQAVLRSIVISVLSVLFSIVLLTPTVWYAYLRYPRFLKVIEGLSFIPFVLPGVVLGLGYVQFFSDGPLALAGTPDLLPFAYTLLAMPYYIQALLNRLRMVDAKTFHDAAQSLGSSNFRAWWRVQVPLLKPGILNGSVLVFTISMGEFAITQLTTGGSYMTLPIYLQMSFQDNPVQGSAMALFSLLISVASVFITLGTLSRGKKVKSQ